MAKSKSKKPSVKVDDLGAKKDPKGGQTIKMNTPTALTIDSKIGTSALDHKGAAAISKDLKISSLAGIKYNK